MGRSFVAAFALVLAACTVAPYDPGAAGRPTSSSRETKKPKETSDDGSQAVVDLGDVTPGKEVEIDVPDDALGFNISVFGEGESRVGIASLVDPHGQAVIRDYVPAGAEGPLALGSRGVGAFSVPQTNGTATRDLVAGTWRLVVSGIDVPPDAPTDKSGTSTPVGTPVRGPLRVSVRIQKSGDGAFHGGELDMHVYVPEGMRIHDPGPVHELHASGLENDAALARRIDAFYSELERLFGIGRGAVSYHVIDGSFREATTGDARAQLIAQATATIPQALHVVFTNEMSYGGGAPLLGYSVGLPGTVNVPGTVRSAISVAVYDDGTADNDAITMLHEMGHFVGLMHTSDDDGAVDLLDDTPTCDTRTKSCPASDNLMAPDGPLRNAEVSPAQVRVVRGSPIYRAHTAR